MPEHEQAARKDIYDLPSLGTVSDAQTVADFADQAFDAIGTDEVVALYNVKNIVEVLELADEDTLRRLSTMLADITKQVTDVFDSLKGKIAAGPFTPTGPEADEDQQEEAKEYIADLIGEHGKDAGAIAAAVCAEIKAAVEGEA
jgi:hypothetical protein